MTMTSFGPANQLELSAALNFVRPSAAVRSATSFWTVTLSPHRAPSPKCVCTWDVRSELRTRTSLAPAPTRCTSQYSARFRPHNGRVASGTSSASAATCSRSAGQIKSDFIAPSPDGRLFPGHSRWCHSAAQVGDNPRSDNQMISFLAGSFAGQHRRDGPDQDLHVSKQALLLDVLHIEVDLPGEIDFRPAADLPEAGDAGFDGEAPAIGQRVQRHLAGNRRATYRRETRCRTAGVRRKKIFGAICRRGSAAGHP